jgi:hypothetical protein
MKDIVLVGSRGGFVPEDVRPAQGDLALVKESPPSGRNLEFEWTARQLDVRAFYVMRNALEGFGAKVHAVQTAVVEDRTPGRMGRPFPMQFITAKNASRCYPGLSEKAALEIETEEPEAYAKSRRCLVDFGGPVPRETLEKLADWMRSWSRLAVMRAFTPPVRPVEKASVILEALAPYDEGSVELVFSLFDAVEEAWNVLFNMLDRFSGTVARIARVSLQ